MDDLIGDNKEKKELFKNRKRKFIYIIPSMNDVSTIYKNGLEKLFDHGNLE